ncbi:DMT family transporter [Clostridium grantii]|uniref:Transporter family-2 protein n=1 Tax=Clostridium grantii DSM 8605 TaxID=1121316 RepID=A0A1M5T7L9_9CLOT|nr:DMT family transporter [Clostridium grantii]SHH46373.1 transporter family-2 protein [Clostridium grantii DSM 8605]
MFKGLAILDGMLISLMVVANGLLAISLGDYASLIVIHTVGLIAITSIILIKKKKISLFNVPFILFMGGAIGIFTLFSNNVCIGELGVTLTLGLGLLGQIIISFVIDHFGLFGVKKYKFMPKKTFGILLMCVGIFAMIKL